jgi:hypothetical protein
MTDLTARLEAAALSLAGPGSIKDRLTDAYSHVEDVEPSDLPELGAEFEQMIQALHRERALPGESAVRASVRKLSPDDVRHYAELLVRLYGMVAGIKHQRNAPRNLPALPKYLVANGSDSS